MVKDRCFIIAEAGVNHNGSEVLALQLIEAAAKAGADAIKFQTFNTEKLVRRGTKTAEYQARKTGIKDQYDLLQSLELSPESYQRIHRYCTQSGIEFMSTPFDEASADFLISLGMRRIKIPSGEITHFPFLEYLAKKNLPLILSTGMSSLKEVIEAVHHLQKVNNALLERLTILHCTSNYPTAFEDVNLKAMLTLKDVLKLPIGYSDHTSGILVAPLAVALGATVIEKHFTLDRHLPGPDHQASLTPDELSEMIKNIRAIELSLGTGIKEPRDSEIPIRNLVRRSVCLKRPMSRGETLSLEDLIFLRPANGISPKEIDKLQGKCLQRDLTRFHVLEWSDIQS